MNSKLAAYGAADQLTQMVERHAPLVKRIAYHLLARLPASVLVDDLIQSGMIGLIEAAKNFDGSKGASLKPLPVSVSVALCWMKFAVATGLHALSTATPA